MLHLLPAALAVAGILFWAFGYAGTRKDARPGRAWTSLVWWPLLSPPLMLLELKLLMLVGWMGPLNVLSSSPGPDRVLWPEAAFWCLSVLSTGAAVLGEVCLLERWTRLVRSDDPRRFLAVTALALVTMALLFPTDALGVTGIDLRWFHLSLAVGIGLLGLVPRRRLVLLGGLAALMCSVNLVQFAAVQFAPRTISIRRDASVNMGVNPVAPVIRQRYYDALRDGRFSEWIFPTAMFRQTPQ